MWGGMSSFSDHETIPHPSLLGFYLNHRLRVVGKHLNLPSSPHLSKINSCCSVWVCVYELPGHACRVLIVFNSLLSGGPCRYPTAGTVTTLLISLGTDFLTGQLINRHTDELTDRLHIRLTQVWPQPACVEMLSSKNYAWVTSGQRSCLDQKQTVFWHVAVHLCACVCNNAKFNSFVMSTSVFCHLAQIAAYQSEPLAWFSGCYFCVSIQVSIQI